MLLVAFTLVILMTSAVYAEPPTVIWKDSTVAANDIALSEDGNYVVVASPSGVRFYSRSSSTPVWIYSAGGAFYSVAISSDGDCVAAGNGSRLCFWSNARSSTGVPTWVTSNKIWEFTDMWRLDMSDDGNYIVAAGSGAGGFVGIYYWADAKTAGSGTKWEYTKDMASIRSVDISRSGDYVVAGTYEFDGYVSYWKNAKTLTGKPQSPEWRSIMFSSSSYVAVSDDGDYVAAAVASVSGVHYWAGAKQLSGLDKTSTWYGGENLLYTSIGMSSDGDSVVAGTKEYANSKVYFWRGAKGLTGKPETHSWSYATGDDTLVGINTAGDCIVAAASKSVLFLDKLGSLKWTPYTVNSNIISISVSSNGETLAVGTGTTGSAYLLDTVRSPPSPTPTPTPTPTPRPVGGVVTSTNKLEILAPYVALAGLIVAVSTVVVVKRKSRY